MQALRFKTVRMVTLLALALAAGRSAHAQHYKVTDLGSLVSGINGGEVAFDSAAINDAGAVVGPTYGYVDGGFLYHAGVMTLFFADAGEVVVAPAAINNNGQVLSNVSSAIDGWTMSIRTNGITTPLPRPASFLQMAGAGLNDSDWVVGGAVLAKPPYSHIGFLSKDGKFSDLGDLGRPFCSPSAINNKGQVTGVAGTGIGPNGPVHAFLFQLDSTGKVVSRTDLGSASWDGASGGNAINDQGEVVGFSYLQNNQMHPFLWSQGKMIDLGLLSSQTSGWAEAINASGQIVGTDLLEKGYAGGSSQRAFLYSNGKLQDLNALISDRSWVLESANGINASGQIVGMGTHHGVQEAFLLTPQ